MSNTALEMNQATAAFLVEFRVTDAEGDVSDVDVRVVVNTNMSFSDVVVFAEDNAQALLSDIAPEGCDIEVTCVTALDGVTVVLTEVAEQTTH